jgi:2-oxoacid:acceptor oxidoreductase delta subunit (pyruvate/2-ketoisovalerate family)
MIEEKKLVYERVRGVPHIREPGSSVRRNTGEWRMFRPEINLGRCIRCKTCWMVCPESAIDWKRGSSSEGPVIDYQLCKGCLVCFNECPVKAITREVEHHGTAGKKKP